MQIGFQHAYAVYSQHHTVTHIPKPPSTLITGCTSRKLVMESKDIKDDQSRKQAQIAGVAHATAATHSTQSGPRPPSSKLPMPQQMVLSPTNKPSISKKDLSHDTIRTIFDCLYDAKAWEEHGKDLPHFTIIPSVPSGYENSPPSFKFDGTLQDYLEYRC